MLIFSLKNIYPNNILKIGIMKYPKLASIILSVDTAYIHTAQLIKINKPEKKSVIRFFGLEAILKKIDHLEK